MKTRIFYFTVVSLFLVQQNSLSQMRRAMFFHGYDSDAATAWENVQQLDDGLQNIPQFWVNEGIIDDFIVPDFGAVVDNQAYGLRVLSDMKLKDPQNNSRWIMVGHSLGGLGARGIEPFVKNGTTLGGIYFPPRNLKGIITLGTPHQGAPIAQQVAYNEAYILSEISRMRTLIEDGPDWQRSYGWIGVVFHGTGDPRTDNTNIFWSPDVALSGTSLVSYRDFSNALNSSYNTIKEYIQQAALNQAYRLAPNSSFLFDINNTPANVPHVSIAGVETSPAFIRFVSTIDDLGAAKFSDEVDAVKIYNIATNMYRTPENYHSSFDTWYYNYFLWPVWFFHHEGMIYWRHGREAIQGLDTKWAEFHNPLLTYTQTSSYDFWVNCIDGSDIEPSYHDLETMFQTVEQYQCDNGLIDGYWTTRYHTYTVYYQDQTDGFIPKSKTAWKKYDDPIISNPEVSASSAALHRQANVSFDGTGEGNDGGYNHGELRFPKRNYGSHGYTQPYLFSKAWTNYWIGQ